MATLNGVEFGIVHITKTIVHDNNIKDIPGSDTVVQDDLGYSTAPMRITGHVKNESEYDDFKEQYYSGGELTLIVDPDSGRQYTVYAHQNLTDLDGDRTYPLTDIVFQAMFFMRNPYLESVTDKIRIKSITSNNQEWSADNDSADIKTDGNVDAIPDIQLTGVPNNQSIIQTTVDTSYPANAGAAGVTINNNDAAGSFAFSYGTDVGQTISCGDDGMAILDSFSCIIDTAPACFDCTVKVYDEKGGTLLGQKTINVCALGTQTWTFDTPIALIKAGTACTTSEIFIVLIGGGAPGKSLSKGTAYAGGTCYINDADQGEDMYFSIVGHSAKEVHQTFQFTARAEVKSVLIKGCDFNYAGANVWTCKIYNGGTLLGTGTATTPGAAFAELEFFMTEETADSLILVASTTYTIKIYPPSDSVNATSVLIQTNSSTAYASGSVVLVEDGGTTRAQTHDIYFKVKAKNQCDSPEIYNTADATVICAVANVVLDTAIHRINADGTGTVDFDDDFTTDKYLYNSINVGVSYDDSNNELDIADDGYIYWKIDTKYPINGTPTLTSRINITSGTPTIQISTDASTWYDIDTAIADDVETVYPLDSDGNLSLAGKTIFYFRIDCVKAAVATCSVKYFKLDINIHTIYAKNPKINKGATASTFRCDQAATSGFACDVELIFPDRWWA